MPHTLHKQEKEQFSKLFKQDQITDFENRFTVMEAFMQVEGHISSAQMIQQLSESGHYLDPEFVRDTLKLFVSIWDLPANISSIMVKYYMSTCILATTMITWCALNVARLWNLKIPQLEQLQIQARRALRFPPSAA